MVGVVGLFVCMAPSSPCLWRCAVRDHALPWWRYFVLLGLAFGWSQLCLLVWKSRAGPLAGDGGGPGNACAKAAAEAGSWGRRFR
jgi:predicted membrane metal-binding protein